MPAALDVSIITFRHSDFALGVSGTGLKGKGVCFAADEELSSWFLASLCLNTSVTLWRKSPRLCEDWLPLRTLLLWVPEVCKCWSSAPDPVRGGCPGSREEEGLGIMINHVG